jgi:hypothetical protein
VCGRLAQFLQRTVSALSRGLWPVRLRGVAEAEAARFATCYGSITMMM